MLSSTQQTTELLTKHIYRSQSDHLPPGDGRLVFETRFEVLVKEFGMVEQTKVHLLFSIRAIIKLLLSVFHDSILMRSKNLR